MEYETNVQNKEVLYKGLIFGLKARLPIGLILGLAGIRREVMPIMQTLSHTTRAYIINANFLPGFLVEFDIIRHLEAAEGAGHLEVAK